MPVGVDVKWLQPRDIVKSCYLTYFCISDTLYITGRVDWKNTAPSYPTLIYFDFQSALSNIGLSKNVTGYIFNRAYDNGSFVNIIAYSGLTLTPSSTYCYVESAGTYERSYITGFFQ